jgi:hypothetical protein
MSIPSVVLAAAVINGAPPQTHVALTFGMSPPPAAVIRTAVDEAAAIWSPYHVAIDQALPCASAPDEATVISVSMGASSAAGQPYPSNIGAIRFSEDGTPDPVVTVYFDLLKRFLAGVRFVLMPEYRWPPALRERILGRGLGRVIAHEIGHYLLGARHAPTGLMRALQYTDELFAVPRTGFTLSRSERRRLAGSSAS